MKRLFFSIIISVVSISSVYSQNISVEDIKVDKKPKEKIDFPKDLNGNQCALIEIKLNNGNVSFEGNVIGDPVYKDGVYQVFLTPNSKYLNVKYPGTNPLLIKFNEHGVKQLPSGSLMTISLTEPDGDVAASLDKNMSSVSREAEELYEAGYNCFMNSAISDAFDYFNQAYEIGHPKAAYLIGMIYSDVNDFENMADVDMDEITNSTVGKYNFLEKFVVKGIAKGLSKLVIKSNGLMQKSPVKKDLETAYKYFLESANDGYVMAQYHVGKCLEKGLGVKKDKKQAKEWYKKAAEQGHLPSMSKLGIDVNKDKYQFGSLDKEFVFTGIDNNMTDLSATTDGGVKDKNNQVCALVKVLLPFENVTFDGDIVGDPSFKTNEYWVFMPQGSTQLRINYPDYKPMTIYFKNSQLNNLESKKTYNVHLSFPFELLQQDQELSSDECYKIAMGYIDRKDNQYLQWLTKASEMGNKYAVAQMGSKYLYGIAVDKDENKGISMLEQASAEGVAYASFYLGQYYESKKNIKKAQEWFDKAAEQGYELAVDRKAKKRVFGIF